MLPQTLMNLHRLVVLTGVVCVTFPSANVLAPAEGGYGAGGGDVDGGDHVGVDVGVSHRAHSQQHSAAVWSIHSHFRRHFPHLLVN